MQDPDPSVLGTSDADGKAAHFPTAREQVEAAAADGDLQAKHLLETLTDAQWEDVEKRLADPNSANGEDSRRFKYVGRGLVVLVSLLGILIRVIASLLPSGSHTDELAVRADAETTRWQGVANNLLDERRNLGNDDAHFILAQIVNRTQDRTSLTPQGWVYATDYPAAVVAGYRTPQKLGLIAISSELHNVVVLNGLDDARLGSRKYAVFYCSDVQGGFDPGIRGPLRTNQVCVLPAEDVVAK